mgnify:CR=1 FL=1
MKKMRNFLTLAAAAALTGILLTGCSTEAEETTAAKAETTAQAETTADAEKGSENADSSKTDTNDAGGAALAGKKISVMTPYLTSVTTNQMAGFIKNNLEAEGAEVFHKRIQPLQNLWSSTCISEKIWHLPYLLP